MKLRTQAALKAEQEQSVNGYVGVPWTPGGVAELERRATRTPVSNHPPPPLPQAAAMSPNPPHGQRDVPVCASSSPRQRSTAREGKTRGIKIRREEF